MYITRTYKFVPQRSVLIDTNCMAFLKDHISRIKHRGNLCSCVVSLAFQTGGVKHVILNLQAITECNQLLQAYETWGSQCHEC